MNSVLGQAVAGVSAGVMGGPWSFGGAGGRVASSRALSRTRMLGPRFGARGLSRIITEMHCTGWPQYVRRFAARNFRETSEPKKQQHNAFTRIGNDFQRLLNSL